MLPVVLHELDSLQTSFQGHQYCLDHTDSCVKMVFQLGKGKVGRLIFDRSMFMDGSSARQPSRLKELWEAGCQMKLLQPKGGPFARMHVKSLMFDKKVLHTGSVNLTHNGHENNKEHMFRITEPTTVAAVVEDFEKDWERAEAVTQPLIDEMLEAAYNRRQQRDKSRSVSRSLSMERPCGRSHSSEHAEMEPDTGN